MSDQAKIILGSTSPYRRQLLERLGLRFKTQAPSCDEAVIKGELAEQALSPSELAVVLARAKCDSIAGSAHSSIVIGSDQVAQLGNRPQGSNGLVKTRAPYRLSAQRAARTRGGGIVHGVYGASRVGTLIIVVQRVRVPLGVRPSGTMHRLRAAAHHEI